MNPNRPEQRAMTGRQQRLPTLEVCFSPALLPFRYTREPFVAVVVDIFRATTTICAAFEAGVEAMIPVADPETAHDYKHRGYLVAAEEDGIKPDYADFGNSAEEFIPENVRGKTIVHCTTNGTRAIVQIQGADAIAIGSFVNLSAITDWLRDQKKNILILCSGWKNRFSLEDAFYAGALAELLIGSGQYHIPCDSAITALDLWKAGKNDLKAYAGKAVHLRRLKKLGLDHILPYTFAKDTGRIVPLYEDGMLINGNLKIEKN